MKTAPLEIIEQTGSAWAAEYSPSAPENTAEALIVPRCCGIPKRPWELCDHISIRNGIVTMSRQHRNPEGI